MITDYTVNDGLCVVCGDKSTPDTPLCSYCYKSLKKFYNRGEDLSYCNKELKYAILKLFAFFDHLENDKIVDSKTEFLLDFALLARPLVQEEDNDPFFENKDRQIEKLTQENKLLNEKLSQLSTDVISDNSIDPRKRWEAKYRANDGHYVRSRAEILIDNWLFLKGIRHIYEKQVTFPNGEKCLCDFYLPDYSAYIEFWGIKDADYLERKNTKSLLYKTIPNVNLIELDDKSLENLDDILENYISNLKRI
jgi:hypothetical protein